MNRNLLRIELIKSDTRNGDGVQGYLRGGGVGVVVRKVMNEKMLTSSA